MSEALMRAWPLPETTAPVFWRNGEAIRHARFKNDMTEARSALARLKQPKIVLFEPDVYAFAVWLLAAWSLGVTVVLPGDDLAATRDWLALPWVGEEGKEAGENALHTWRAAGAFDDSDCDFGAPGLMLFTSGSSGNPSLVEKSLEQLRREIDAQEAAFGACLVSGSTRFVSSVPHQHMYGLPFLVLWPLSFAYAIVAEKLRYPEDIWRLPAADYALVSAPTFLKHLSQPAVNICAAPEARWQLAISAGSPLSPEIGRRCRHLLDAPVFEIYGSTETGAVAYRQDGMWQAMPGVRLSVDGATSRLRVHSPFLSPEYERDGFLSNDLARMNARGLELVGRSDRIVKIGEKRISMRRVEAALATLADIECAAVVPLRGERDALGAVIILSAFGERQKESLGKARFDRYLRHALRDQLDVIALPRRWRYVEAMPVNAMGKTTQRDLQDLFAPQFPQVECLTQSRDEKGNGQVCLQLRLSPDIIWFDGHFPHLPVLPGVVQIDWAAHFGRLHFGFNVPVTGVAGLKFRHLLRPGDAPALHLSWHPGKAELEFIYTLDEKPCSRGVLILRHQEPAPSLSQSIISP
jgi:acyl-coenzyme A synthetase/AMP-(fatty) acid ligase